MDQKEAIQRAIEFAFEQTGVRTDPDTAKLLTSVDGRRYWSIVFKQEPFFSQEEATEATADGPWVLRVGDATGEVSILG